MLKSYLDLKRTAAALLTALGFVAAPVTSALALDQYPGDTAIYGVNTGSIQPNVLIILDNSGSMNDTIDSGVSYNPATAYPVTAKCDGTGPCLSNKVYNWKPNGSQWISYIDNVASITCAKAHDSLVTNGVFNGKLNTGGTCSSSAGSYATGNYINWSSTYGPRKKIDIAKEVLSKLLYATTGVNFGLMIYNTDEGAHIAGVSDGYGYLGYSAYVKDMDVIFTGSTTNKTALLNTISNINAGTWTPLGETLFEAMRYYKGAATAFPTQNGSITYTTPIAYSCQKNYIVLITDGMSTQDQNAVLRTICNNGDCDGDGKDPGTFDSNGSDYLDDVAKYLYDTDLLPDGADAKTIGKQNVITNTIGFGLTGADAAAVALLQETAYNGGGNNYLATSTSGLSESLRQILATIIEDNTSFVAPVVPVSPENRTFSGRRIYMGFFKPQPNAFWSGNLKKYGLDNNGSIVDKNGNAATNADGSIRDNAVSFWSPSADGSDVELGGAGALLITRTTPRNIYTFTGTSTNLNDATNAFLTTNNAITPAMLAVADSTEKDSLINYVRGMDAYDQNSNGITTEKRDWLLGDVLHSKPLIVNYTSFTLADEGNCSVNKNLIYVGSNDGMLHAFSDCDGQELWSFVPPDLFTTLKYMHSAAHSYYVDSSPTAYIYDANNNGVIETGNGDKVIIMFGERRGGGYYYALDVSNPSNPVYMWRLSSTESPSGVNTDYSELAETWSEPVIAKTLVQVSGVDTKKVVAFVGAGYDNAAEDPQPATASTKGRGVYAIEIATLSSGVPTFGTSGRKVWGYTYADNSTLTRSVPAQLSVIDTDGNGYADRIYAATVGGSIWRFNIGSSLTSNWSANAYKIFVSNPGADASTGRKMFYRPSLTLEVGYDMLFFGTGDREHPIDTTVVDRLYAVKDTNQTSAKTEGDLTDATGTISVDIASSSGWYIKLSTNGGEKDLAYATVLNKIVYYTTFTPSSSGSTVCGSDNRGTSRFYALKYLTAGPAYNLNLSSDPLGTAPDSISDRSKVIGTGIPSGVVSVLSSSGVSAIVGSGGALVTPPVDKSGTSIPTYWREVR